MKKIGLWAILPSFIAGTAYASGVDKINGASVDVHSWTFEYTLSRLDDEDQRDLNNAQQHKLEIVYGFSDRLEASMEIHAARQADDPFHATNFGPKLKYVVTKQDPNSWWLSTALYGKYLFSLQGDQADRSKIKFIAQRKQGPVNVLLNIVGDNQWADNSESGMEFGTQLQTIYHTSDAISPGIEWQADYGKINDMKSSGQQEHYLGPIITGKVLKSDHGALKYVAGFYWGLTTSSADHAARIQLDYGVEF